MESQWQQQARALLGQLSLAVARFLVLLIFVGMHLVLRRVTELTVPASWTTATELLEGVYLVGFGLLYVDQVPEMVAVFIPRVRRLRARLFRGDTGDREVS
ncbi:MAG: hypothetical protein ACRDGM_18240 [bacterium]